jgi:hypothetical protein
MHVISIDEAKRLVSVLQQTYPCKKSPCPSRGKWLNHLARADGYRDWNVMAAKAPAQPPDLKFGQWGDLFIAVAWVEAPNSDPSFYMLGTRDRDAAHPHNGWPGQLAGLVNRHFPRSFHGEVFDYGRPQGDLWDTKEWYIPNGSSSDPVVLRNAKNSVRILLWWLEGRYTEATNLQSEHTLQYQLNFVHSAYGKEPRTEQFLRHLTLQQRPRRTCLYVPEVANAGVDLYVPVIVTEEEPDGIVAAGWAPGDWMSIGERTALSNSQAGLSRVDVRDIAERYAYFEPKQEDDDFEFYGMSED